MNKHNIYDSATSHTIKSLEKRIEKLEEQNKLLTEKYNFAIDFIFDYMEDIADEYAYLYSEPRIQAKIHVYENED